MLFNKTTSTLAFAALAALLSGYSPPARAGDDSRAAAKPGGKTAGTLVDEALLSLKVRTKLLTEVKYDALHIHVDVEGSSVTLSGTMKKKSSLDLAEEVAKSVDGVKHVNNKLELKESAAAEASDGPEVPDALLETKIKSKLLAKTGVGAFKIEVEASSGVVSLSGSVPSKARRDEVMRIARETDGAKEVHDLLKIKADD
jgi:osmotically-inducible protein OsmY